MMIIAVILCIIFSIMLWGVIAGSSRNDRDDELQMQALEEWRRQQEGKNV